MTAPIAAAVATWLALTVPPAPLAEPEPAPQFEAVVTVKANQTLDEVVRSLAAVLQTSLTFDEGMANHLAETPTGLLRDAVVPAERFPAFAEGLLALNAIGITAVRVEDPAVFVLHHAKRPPLDPPREDGRELPTLADHAALRTATYAEFEAVDEAQLPALLAPVMDDTVLTVLKAGNGAVFVGAGVVVHDFVRLLHSVAPDAAPAGFAPTPDELFPVPEGDLALDGADTLFEVVQRYAELTGTQLAFAERAAKNLHETRIAGGRSRIPAGEVHAFVGSLLWGADLAMTAYGRDEPHLVAVYDKGWSGLMRRLPVELESADDLERLMAVELMIPVRLETADARQIPTLLRSLGGASHDVSLFSLGQRVVVLCGLGGDLLPYWRAIEALENS